MFLAKWALHFNGEASDHISIVQKTEANENEYGLFGLSCDLS